MAQTITIEQLSFPEHCINGDMKLVSYDEGDVVVTIRSAEQLAHWKEEFIKRYGADGTITIDPSAVWFERHKLAENAKYEAFQRRYIESKAACLKEWNTTH